MILITKTSYQTVCVCYVYLHGFCSVMTKCSWGLRLKHGEYCYGGMDLGRATLLSRRDEDINMRLD